MNLYPYILQRNDEPFLISVPGLPQRQVMRLRYFAANAERLGCIPPFSRDELAAIFCYLISEGRTPEETSRKVSQLSLFPQNFAALLPSPRSCIVPARKAGKRAIHPTLPGF